MKKASDTTYKVGSLGDFARWTQRVIRDPAAASGEVKQWFDSDATAQVAAARAVSAEAMVKLLSPGNLDVLHVIQREHPSSVRELAALTGRAEASLSRTLKRFAQAGIVTFQDGPNRTRAPEVIAARVRLEIDLLGAASSVAVEPGYAAAAG